MNMKRVRSMHLLFLEGILACHAYLCVYLKPHYSGYKGHKIQDSSSTPSTPDNYEYLRDAFTFQFP